MPRSRSRFFIASFSLLAILGAIGAWVAHRAAAVEQSADGHKSGAAAVKAPLAEMMHCPLAFAGVHLLKSDPAQSRVAYHFCKPVNSDLNQCVLLRQHGSECTADRHRVPG